MMSKLPCMLCAMLPTVGYEFSRYWTMAKKHREYREYREYKRAVEKRGSSVSTL